MNELSQIDNIVIPLAAIIGGTVTAVVAIVTYHFRRSQRDEMDTTLKLEMIERGMSADDIERILQAKAESTEATAAR